MNERYLQWIWSQKRLYFNNLKLTDGRDVHVLDVGQINLHDAGPDFKMGIISLDNLRMVGDIEIHVRSSEWYQHGHHNDINYNTVVLHVVYEDDKPVKLGGEVIPTLELKSLIDDAHFQKFERFNFNYNPFICASQLNDVPFIYLSNMMGKALHQRLLSKANMLIKRGIVSEIDGFYHFLATAFGTNRNKQGFTNLISKIHPAELKKLNRNKIIELYMVESGIYAKESTHVDQWNYRMVRPGNSPRIRVQQFAHLMAIQELDVSFQFTTPNNIIDYFTTLYKSFNKYLRSMKMNQLSLNFVNHLMINSIIPYLYYVAELKGDELYRDKSIEILQSLKAEHNAITDKWKSIIKIENAYDSQALLSLNAQYCSRKKCLNCEVGNNILNRQE